MGGKIRNERNRLGLSLEALARKVGISKMTLHRIETGMTSPSIITLTEISFHLKKPIESLIHEGDPKVVLIKKAKQDNIMDPESGIRVLAPRGLITDRITLTWVDNRFLEGHRPATTLVFVKALARPPWLIEIEAVAAAQ